MPAEYPKKTENYDEEEEEEEEEEDEQEEEQEEWTDLVDLEELEELEDGPSTYFVGGFSTAHKLSEPLAAVQYQQDRILIYPGVYGNGTRQPHETLQEEVVIDEARLRGLSIEGVPFARGVKGGYPSARQERQQNAFAGHVSVTGGIATSGSNRRVGPWFLHAAAAAQTLAEQEGKLLLSDEERAAKTSMGSSVYQPTLTCTEVDPAHFPVLASKLIFTYPQPANGGAASQTSTEDGRADGALRVYEQEKDEEMEDDDGEGEGDGDGGDKDDAATEDSDGAGSGAGGRRKKSPPVSVRLQGVCVVYGVELQPLSRALLRHNVIGVPTARHPQFAHSMPSAVVAHPLAEAALERCIIYGGTQHGVYAYPRSLVRLSSCLIDGPSVSGHYRGVVSSHRSERHLSSLARLEYRAKQRQAAATATQTLKNTNSHSSHGATATAGPNGTVLPPGELAHFTIPTATCCEVGLFADDADLVVRDVLISNTRLGLLCHDACTGLSIAASDVRSVEQVGVYIYGSAGCPRIAQCNVRACGRECLLVVGPTEGEVEGLEAAYKAEHGETDNADDEEEEEEEEAATDGGAAAATGRRRRPIFAAHPAIRHCCLTGGVRLQGCVRDGAMVDNAVFQPAEEGPLSVKAVGSQNAAQKLVVQPNFGVSGNWTGSRGFHVVGVEGASVTPAVEA